MKEKREVDFVSYNDEFKELSWGWLNDPEIRFLTNTPVFSKASQDKWFVSLSSKKDYFIRGIQLKNSSTKIGVVGLKDINQNSGEYWGYIGDKKYWGKGIGREMMAYIENYALSINLNSIYLKVLKSNQRAKKLYLKFGFQIDIDKSTDLEFFMTKEIKVKYLKVFKYVPTMKSEWDRFIENSKNGTFLFKRDFMEYHRDRFTDYSLMIYFKEKLVACFPANIDKNHNVTSHGGLTYGGIVISESIRLNEYLNVFREVLFFLNSNSVATLYYKSIPCFYTTHPSEEDSYALFLLNAGNYRTDVALTIKNKAKKTPYQTRRKRSIKKADKLNIRVENKKGYDIFWKEILEPNLKKRFGKKPVHSLEEIQMLDAKFPSKIHQINIFCDDNIVAGCTVFETKTTAHAQYISGNDFGRNSGALDKLFDELINNVFSEKEYFDFGICNEEAGKYINHGLLDWKEGFGGRTYVHRFHKIETNSFKRLDSVIK